jgi:hypothetical protein
MLSKVNETCLAECLHRMRRWYSEGTPEWIACKVRADELLALAGK